jgi:hypothetical protein
VVKPGAGTADTRHTASAPKRAVTCPPWDCTVWTPAPPSWQSAAGVAGGFGAGRLGVAVCDGAGRGLAEGVREGDGEGLGDVVIGARIPPPAATGSARAVGGIGAVECTT